MKGLRRQKTYSSKYKTKEHRKKVGLSNISYGCGLIYYNGLSKLLTSIDKKKIQGYRYIILIINYLTRDNIFVLLRHVLKKETAEMFSKKNKKDKKPKHIPLSPAFMLAYVIEAKNDPKGMIKYGDPAAAIVVEPGKVADLSRDSDLGNNDKNDKDESTKKRETE